MSASQMAAALFNLAADPAKACGISAAGPRGRRPCLVERLRELGLDR